LRAYPYTPEIQDNPTLMGQAFRAKLPAPRKPKRIDQTDVAGPLPRRSQPTPSKGKRLRPGSFSHAERLALADRRALRGQPAGACADPPALALAIEPNEMIGGAVAWVARGGGG
jgi:hypothetical protein